MSIPPLPRTWKQALAHPGIAEIRDHRKEFRDSEDMEIQIILESNWLLDGDLSAFYVNNLADLREHWNWIMPAI